MRKHLSLACALAVAGSLLITSPASAALKHQHRAAPRCRHCGRHPRTSRRSARPSPKRMSSRACRPAPRGRLGHEASVDYVVEKMEAAGFNVTLQEFEADIFFEQAPAAFAADRRRTRSPIRVTTVSNGVWYTADFSGDGDVTARSSGRRLHRADHAARAPQTPAARQAISRADVDGQDRAAATRHL